MANRRTTYKTITHIPGQIRVILPNGTRKTFQNSDDAQAFFDQNYGDDYFMEITPTTDNNGEVAINGRELQETVIGKAPDKPKEPEPVDPVIAAIFEGRYNGRKFTPTPANIQHFLDLYESDKRIAEEYGGKAWGKILGTHLLAGAGIYAGLLTAPAWAPAAGNWLWNTGAPMFAKHIATPTAAGMIWDEGQRALTGTTTTEQISNYLQNEKGWNPIVADMTGGLSNPGYWINFGGTGRYTRPLFNKIGLGLPNPSTPIELSPTIQANINARMLKSKLQTKVIDPALAWTDRNLYRIQAAASPWLLFRKPMTQTSAELPSFRFVRNPEELQALTDNMKYEYPKVGGQVQDYLLFKSNTNNQKVFGEAMDLRKPEMNLKFYNEWRNPLFQVGNTAGAGIASADLLFGDSDRNPYIRGLEYLALGRYGVNALARRRVIPAIGEAKSYFNIFQDLRSGIENNLRRYYKVENRAPRDVEGRGYIPVFDQNGVLYFPENYQFKTAKPGFNYKKASFDDLVRFLDKNKILNRHLRQYSTDANTLYDSSGRVLARRSQDGKIEIFNEQELRNVLSKDIDIVDYATGNRYTGRISVGDDGTVNIPEEYTNTLRSNIDYVQNTLFPGSGVKVFGSSAGVTEAGFPHATHDVDFYITQNEIDKLLASGMLKESDRINPGTYTYRLNPSQFGEQGNIDLNVLEQTPEGMATGIRAEELFRQYFPDDYFKALREFKAGQANGTIPPTASMSINKTPEELLSAMNPSSKTIMDSFDIDFTAPAKGKHALRSWAHLVYSDPQQVSQGLNQYAKSMLGSRAQLFPMTAEQLGNKELNLQALQKLGIQLRDFELDRIASDPQRMKNVLDAWYMMDNTAMRYIKGTWPGTPGYSSENFVKSATTWTPELTGGNAHGTGLNVTIGGDSNHSGDLKAFISPNTQYKSTNLLDMIDEINYNFGGHPDSPRLLSEASYAPLDEQVSRLQNVFDTRGWNFLRDMGTYGEGNYASATRTFDLNSDFIGFTPLRVKLNPLIPRIKPRTGSHPLEQTGYTAPFAGQRRIPTPWDHNQGWRPYLHDVVHTNTDRNIQLRHPFKLDRGTLGQGDFAPFKVQALTLTTPTALTGTLVGLTALGNQRRRNWIQNAIDSPDEVILSMPEEDRNKFTQQGVDSLRQANMQLWGEDATDDDLTRGVYYDLRDIYDKYNTK